MTKLSSGSSDDSDYYDPTHTHTQDERRTDTVLMGWDGCNMNTSPCWSQEDPRGLSKKRCLLKRQTFALFGALFCGETKTVVACCRIISIVLSQILWQRYSMGWEMWFGGLVKWSPSDGYDPRGLTIPSCFALRVARRCPRPMLPKLSADDLKGETGVCYETNQLLNDGLFVWMMGW